MIGGLEGIGYIGAKEPANVYPKRYPWPPSRKMQRNELRHKLLWINSFQGFGEVAEWLKAAVC
jgi:hypothetical protein